MHAHRSLTALSVPLSTTARTIRGGALLMAINLAITLATTLAVPLSAHAQTEALQRCQRIAEPVARLACYDAVLPPARAAAAAATTPAATPAAKPPSTSTTATTPAAAAASTATAAAPSSATAASTAGAAAAAAPAHAADRFGLPERARSEPLFIESSVANDFYGWDPNTRIRLNNGQVWQVIDGSSGTVNADNRRVKVTRGALGSFFLEFEGMNKAPRVRRVE